jgi:hypothetical protein
MPVEFIRTISESEVRSTYLNLTDDSGRRYGKHFPPHKTKLRIIDDQGRRTHASMHNVNQIWGSIQNWFSDNHVRPGDVVKVAYEPGEQDEGRPIVRLALIREGRPPSPLPKPAPPAQLGKEESPELPVSLEKQIEDFLVHNVALIEPGLTLYADEDRQGRQYPTDVGVIDMLCRRPDGDYVVVELKRGRGSDAVVGQVSRYMGWVKENLAGSHRVFGIILAADADEEMRYAVAAHPNLLARYFAIKLELTDEPPGR